MKAERLILLKEINRLTFENAVAPADDEPTRLALESDRRRACRSNAVLTQKLIWGRCG
jgi:hypothetical protein